MAGHKLARRRILARRCKRRPSSTGLTSGWSGPKRLWSTGLCGSFSPAAATAMTPHFNRYARHKERRTTRRTTPAEPLSDLADEGRTTTCSGFELRPCRSWPPSKIFCSRPTVELRYFAGLTGDQAAEVGPLQKARLTALGVFTGLAAGRGPWPTQLARRRICFPGRLVPLRLVCRLS